MSVSQSHLYRKLKALTGKSISGYIKIIKLHIAKEILTSSNYTSIKEVAIEVGFTDQRYFSKCYKEQFGVSPSQFIVK